MGDQTRASADDDDRGRTRRRILRAAEQCFVDFGPARTTMVDVARIAGVSRPTVYRYFRDRDALVVEVALRRIRAALQKVEPLLVSDRGLAPALTEALARLVEGGRTDPVIRRLFVERDEALPSADVWAVALAESALFWTPVLKYARETGELREGLDLDDACSWLSELLLFLAAREPRHRVLDTLSVIETFVVPSLLKSSPS